MFGVPLTHNVVDYYENWVKLNVGTNTGVVFEINEQQYVLEHSVLDNERSEHSVMRFLKEKKATEIEGGQVIHIPGGKQEEHQWFIYFDYLKQDNLIQKELTSREAVEYIITLLYFGVDFNSSLIYVGVTNYTLPEVMGNLLTCVDRKLVDCLKTIDQKKEFEKYFKKGAKHLVTNNLQAYEANKTNIRNICQYYGFVPYLDEIVSVAIKIATRSNEQKTTLHIGTKKQQENKIAAELNDRLAQALNQQNAKTKKEESASSPDTSK